MIAEAEKRLPPVASVLGEEQTPAPNAETPAENAPAAPTENAAETPAENTPAAPEEPAARTGLHPSIDLTEIYEANSCEDLCRRLTAASYDPKTIYHGETALFKIVENDNETPVNTLSGLFEEVKKNGRQGLRIQRYKGLGEMDPHQLWETTMDPERRKMIQVTMEDAIEAERMFTLLMGDDVDPRREYIEKHAAGVKDLDI